VCLKAAGYFGVWTAGAAWYIAFAEPLNETWFRGRVCLPVFLPFPYQELQLSDSLALYALQLQTYLHRTHRHTLKSDSILKLSAVNSIITEVILRKLTKLLHRFLSWMSWMAGSFTMLCRALPSRVSA